MRIIMIVISVNFSTSYSSSLAVSQPRRTRKIAVFSLFAVVFFFSLWLSNRFIAELRNGFDLVSLWHFNLSQIECNWRLASDMRVHRTHYYCHYRNHQLAHQTDARQLIFQLYSCRALSPTNPKLCATRTCRGFPEIMIYLGRSHYFGATENHWSRLFLFCAFKFLALLGQPTENLLIYTPSFMRATQTTVCSAMTINITDNLVEREKKRSVAICRRKQNEKLNAMKIWSINSDFAFIRNW